MYGEWLAEKFWFWFFGGEDGSSGVNSFLMD